MPRAKLPRRKCLNCRKECSNPTKVYCNNTCQASFLREQKLKQWKTGEWDGLIGEHRQLSDIIRNHLIQKVGGKCQRCSWSKVHKVTGKVPLQIDHIDGNPENNRPNNLKVLCPNCHSLTPHFGNLNRGRGRGTMRKLRLKSA